MIAIVLATLLTASPEADAAKLFDEARAAMKAKEWDLACQKLEASRRLKSTLGTLLNLGVCLENRDKAAAAHRVFSEAATLAQQTHDSARATYAAQRLEALRSKVAWLTLEPAAAPRPGARLHIADLDLEASSAPVTLAVDPGQTTVELSAEGHAPATLTIDLAPGAGSTLVLPRLEPLTPEGPMREEPPAPVVLTPAPPSPPPLVLSEPMERRPSHRPAFLAGLVVSGLLLVASCVGLVWGRSTADRAAQQQTTGVLVITRSQYETAAVLHPLSFGGLLGGLAGSIAFGALVARERQSDPP